MTKKKVTNEEAYQSSLEYFNGDELAARVWVNKYALKDKDGNLLEKNPTDMHWRLANEIARIEDKYPNPISAWELFDLMDKFKYIVPQGSPMAGIGNDNLTSLSNCFVVGNEGESDSYGGIMKIDEEIVQIEKRRGGCGVDLSNIRTKGSPVKNSALTSTGVVPFMERYSNSTREVAQGGRRGALMLSMSVKHPDIVDFIDAKLEQGKVTGANISVKLTDEFMESLDNGKPFKQQYPIDSVNPKVTKEIDPNTIWGKITHNAWKSAEPGLLFWDTILRESVPDCYADLGFKTISTNPCQPAWANVLTKDGLKKMGDVKVGDVIWSAEGWTTVVRKRSSGVKDVYEYRTTAGSFKGTENHRLVSNGVKIEAKDATSVDILGGCDSNNIVKDDEYLQSVMDGLVIGDGSVHKASNNLVFLYIGQNDNDYFDSEIKELIVAQRKDLKSNGVAYEVKTTIQSDELPKTFNRSIPNRLMYENVNNIKGLLRGLYSANGSVVSKRVTYKTSSPKMRDSVMILLSSIGIRSYYTTNRKKKFQFSNGEYECKESYDVNISTDRDIFFRSVGFLQKYKMDKLSKTLSEKLDYVKTSDIIETTYISTEEVFNITVDNSTHTYWTDGLNVSNCSELALCAFDSCRLLSLNLFSYVENPFEKNASFDFNLLESHAIIAQRVMDDIIDLELEKIDKILEKINSDPESDELKYTERRLWEKIKDKCERGRRTGVGITAEGDMLAAMGLRYGSQEAIDFSSSVHRILASSVYMSSTILAEERGAFPIFDLELEKNNPFLERLYQQSDNIKTRMEKYGRRNIACLTIAPTGTTSLMTQTTSGIEPAFMVYYKRRRKVNPSDKDAHVDFVDTVGDSWEEYIVFHHKYAQWMRMNGYDPSANYSPEQLDEIFKKSPYYKATSNDIDWLMKVRMQGAIQKWIDHSISVTINLPKEATEELVGKLYKEAWKVGCKGCTVYRDGSRDGVLVSASEKKDNKEDKETEKEVEKPMFVLERPYSLECDIVRFQNNKEKWVALIGLMDGRPYEIFTGLQDEEEGIVLPASVKSGHILKNKDEDGHSRYDFQFVNKKGYKTTVEGLSQKFNEEYWNYAKMISGVLRYGMPVDQTIKLVSSLQLHSDSINTWKNGVVRSLKKYVKDGTEAKGAVCPNCGQHTLIYQEGCLICTNCGSSKCG